MRLDQNLVDAAIAQAVTRFPTGYAGAAAVYTSEGKLLTSVCFDTPNELVNLCHETGAYCEANRLNQQVTATVCVSRATSADPFIILTPCGVCQERLATWGLSVEVAVPHSDDATKWQAKSLAEIQPHYWRNAIK